MRLFVFPLSRLIQVGILILSLVGELIPTRDAHADNPPPILPGGWRTFTPLVYKVEWGGEMRASLDLLQKQLDELKRKLCAST